MFRVKLDFSNPYLLSQCGHINPGSTKLFKIIYQLN